MGITWIGSGRFAAAGGFDPTSITGCDLWFDASDASTFTLSGSDVTQWDDKSGNARHMTGASGSYPSRDGTIGSLTAVQFAAAEWLTGATFTPSSTSTLFVVMTTADTSYILVSAASGVAAAWIATSGSGSGVVTTGGASLSSARVDGAAATISTRGTLYTAFDGTHQITLFYTGFNNISPVNLNIWQGSFQFVGSVGEVLLYNSSLGSTDRDDVESYLKTKWGTP